jgi:hypothetical protein
MPFKPTKFYNYPKTHIGMYTSLPIKPKNFYIYPKAYWKLKINFMIRVADPSTSSIGS